jgi:hypothetical protein
MARRALCIDPSIHAAQPWVIQGAAGASAMAAGASASPLPFEVG